MPVIVKICGITNVEDGLAAATAGADVVGFVFAAPSPRLIQVETAAEISRQLPPFVMKAGVFVNPSESAVRAAIEACGLNLLQFHGDEAPEFCTQFGVMTMKAFRVRDADYLQRLTDYPTDAWLLDAWSPVRAGGTGETFNWDLAIEARRLGRPIFLAGGLTAGNVKDAVEKVDPFGVDVSSGVESAPGKKDHEKVSAFIQAAKSALPG